MTTNADRAATLVRVIRASVGEGDRICALRQYWDELSLYEQLGLLAPRA